MVEIPFYAPMKSPDHPKPSGDRTMARALIKALEHREGAKVFIASQMRSRNGSGDAKLSADIIEAAAPEIRRLTAIGMAQDWPFWVTYHNYYKAPDLIGPEVCDALDIPYVQIESTRARKRLEGPWAAFAQRAEGAADAAAVIFYQTKADLEALEAYRAGDQVIAHLPPFLAVEDLPFLGMPEPRQLCVAGMMREGDKLASYQALAAALAHVSEPYQITIAGDGPARPQVEALFPQARFMGQLDAEGLSGLYAQSAAFVWPGVNEAYGMVYLEAQAYGVPVLAEDRPGVRDVVYGELCAMDDPVGFAAAIDRLLAAPEAASELGQAARAKIEARHLLGSASKALWLELERFL